MSMDASSDATILIVDDEIASIRLLERILTRAGYGRAVGTTDPRTVAELFAQHRPDIALVDMHMPHASGLEVLETLRALTPEAEFLPVVVITGDTTPEIRERALAAGAHDFLTKPLDLSEVRLRIRNLLQTRALNLQVLRQNEELEGKVLERTEQLSQARLEALEQLARVAEFRDDLTGQHTRRVGRVSARIARALELDAATVELVRRAAPLHDIGKIGIPDAVLLKPGRLEEEEMAVMRSHTTIGASILANSRSPALVMGREIAQSHHERWDGDGYPHGLGGEEIPLPGRIVAVADTFDAITHERPYKPAATPDAALAEIRSQAGRQFDPAVVEAFMRCVPVHSHAESRRE